MKKFYLLLVCICLYAASFSQTIVVSGQCITGNITLTYVTDIDGKPAYQGSGTILASPGVQISIFWVGAPDNVWVIAFDGQPFYQNVCNTMIPPGTSPNICPWTVVAGNPACTGSPLSVTGAVILPVTLVDFTASPAGNNVLLRWSTAQEINNRGFTVQHSADGQTWTDLGFVAGAGNSSTTTSYNYSHTTPNSGVNFYRLKQEDIDGRITYSPVATATIQSNAFFTIANNPGNGTYKIFMQASAVNLTELQVADAAGRIILQEKTTTLNPVVDISRRAPGVYWLRIKKGDDIATVKLIKL